MSNSFTRQYFAGRTGFDRSEFEELLETDLETIEQVFDRLSFAGAKYFDNYCPKSWSAWRDVRGEPLTDKLVPTLRWHIFKISRTTKKLASCLVARESIESKFMTGKVVDSQAELSEFESKFGKSLWGLHQFFRICEITNGTQFNRTELRSFTVDKKANRHQRWSNYIGFIFSIKSELELSQHDFEELLREINVAPESTEHYARNYLRYRVFSRLPVDGKVIADIMHYDQGIRFWICSIR